MATKKKYQDGGPMIKSKKVRDVSLNTFGRSYAKTTKTKRDGSTVTKSIDTTRGYVPTASMTKTVTDKEGNTSTSTKDMDYNQAVRKQLRTGRRAGRNPEDQVTVNGRKNGGAIYKTGGVVNPNASVSVTKVSKGRPTKSAEPKSVVKKPKGKVGGISKAPKSANPKK